MKIIVFNKFDFTNYKEIYLNLSFKLERYIEFGDNYEYNHDLETFEKDFMNNFKCEEDIRFIFLNFNDLDVKNSIDDHYYSKIISIFENYVKNHPNNTIEFYKKEKTNIFVFDRKKYQSYKNLYEDLAIKLDHISAIPVYDNVFNYNYNPECIDDSLRYSSKSREENTFIFLNFDRESIRNHKNYEEYQYNIIFEVFESFVRDYPNNKLIFKDEE